MDKTRLRIVGQAWILAAAVENWSISDWRNFAVNRYAQGGWVKFKWGIMGYLSASAGDLPKFELFFEASHQKTLENFLYKNDLPAFLIAFLKISQFICDRFQKTKFNLRESAGKIESWRKETNISQPGLLNKYSIIQYSSSKPVRFGTLEKTVRFGNEILLGYSAKISDLAEYIHTAEVNSSIIGQIISKHRGKISPFSAYHFWHQEIILFREQMNVEQKYHDIIYNHLRSHFEALKVVTELKKSKFEYLLALVAIVVGVIVGSVQVLTSVADAFWRNVIVAIIVMFIIVSIILAIILSIERFKTDNDSE